MSTSIYKSVLLDDELRVLIGRRSEIIKIILVLTEVTLRTSVTSIIVMAEVATLASSFIYMVITMKAS